MYDLYESDTFDSDDSRYDYDLSADRASNSADSSSESHYSDFCSMRHGPHEFGCHCHGSVIGAKVNRDDTDTHQDLQQLEFYRGIAGLLLSTEHSQDLRIKVGETIFPAHRCIVSIRTKFFSSALTESPIATDTITIEGHSACTVWSFLQWCYMGRYYFKEQTELIPGTLMPSAPFQSMESEYTGADRHVRIYYLAKHLQCLGLEEYAAHEYREFWLQVRNWDRMSFMQSAREIFAKPINADSKLCCLRESVTSVAGHYHSRLKRGDGYGKEYEKLLKEVPGFAGGLIWGRSCGPMSSFGGGTLY